MPTIFILLFLLATGQALGSRGPFPAFSVTDTSLTHLAVHRVTGEVFVGAVNHLIRPTLCVCSNSLLIAS